MNLSKFRVTKLHLSLLAISGSLAVFSTTASAQFAPGYYVGGNVGSTRAHFNNNAINNDLASKGFTVTSTTSDNRDTGYKLFGGYQINPNFAVEGGYFDLGRFGYSSTTIPTGSFSGSTRVKGLNLDLLGMLPLSERFSIFGRIGAAYAQSKASFSSTGAVPLNLSSRNRNGTDLKYGVGLQYALSDALALRAEVERYRINDPLRNRGNVNMASLGLVYSFGEKAQTPVAPAYVPVASPPPAPAPAPVYVAPPPVETPPPAPVYEPPVRPAKQGRN